MKNLLKKILFILLFLSAAVASAVQAISYYLKRAIELRDIVQIQKALSDANAGRQSMFGITPLLYAIHCRCNFETVKLLLENNRADVDRKGPCGITPLIHAANRGYLNIVKLLIAEGADAGRALISAARNGRLKTVKLLLDSGAEINKQNNDGRTALMEAAYWEHLKVVELLLKNKADIDKEDCDGRTALTLAAEQGYSEIIELLLDKGAEVNKQGEDDWTALMYATAYGQFKVVFKLLEHGADSYTKNNDGKNAFDLIRERTYFQCATVSEESGLRRQFKEAMLTALNNKKK